MLLRLLIEEAKKILDLHTLVAKDQPDILAVTETFLSNNVNDSELVDCSKYRVFRKDRDRRGGGVMVMVRSNLMNLPAARRKDLETDCEIIWIELLRRNKPVLFGVYSRPPNPSLVNQTTPTAAFNSFRINTQREG